MNFIYLRSPRIFGSLSMIDLEKGKIQFKKEKRSSLTIDRWECLDHCRRSILEKGEWFAARKRSGFHSLSIEKRLQIIVDNKSRKGKTSFGDRWVNWTHLRSTRVLRSLSTINLKEEEIHLEKERDMHFTHVDRGDCSDHRWRLV